MLRAKVFPPTDFLYAFLQTRGFLLVQDKENILHYMGSDSRELTSLLREDKPDLLIIHSRELAGKFPSNVFWVYHPVKTEKDLYRSKKLLTNSYRLCQHYYQKLGLQKEIVVLERPKKKETHEINFAFPKSFFQRIWVKACQIMYWQ